MGSDFKVLDNGGSIGLTFMAFIFFLTATCTQNWIDTNPRGQDNVEVHAGLWYLQLKAERLSTGEPYDGVDLIDEYCECPGLGRVDIRDARGRHVWNFFDGTQKAYGVCERLNTVRAFAVMAVVFSGLGVWGQVMTATKHKMNMRFVGVVMPFLAAFWGMISMAVFVGDTNRDNFAGGGERDNIGKSFWIMTAAWPISLLAGLFWTFSSMPSVEFDYAEDKRSNLGFVLSFTFLSFVFFLAALCAPHWVRHSGYFPNISDKVIRANAGLFYSGLSIDADYSDGGRITSHCESNLGTYQGIDLTHQAVFESCPQFNTVRAFAFLATIFSLITMVTQYRFLNNAAKTGPKGKGVPLTSGLLAAICGIVSVACYVPGLTFFGWDITYRDLGVCLWLEVGGWIIGLVSTCSFACVGLGARSAASKR